MATLQFIAIVVPAIGIPWVAMLGWAHRVSRLQIAAAADLTKKGEFQKARQLVLNATRLNTRLRHNPDVRALYDIILAGSAAGALGEIDRIKSASSTWPTTRVEAIATNGWFMTVVLLLVLFSVMSRLAAIH